MVHQVRHVQKLEQHAHIGPHLELRIASSWLLAHAREEILTDAWKILRQQKKRLSEPAGMDRKMI